MKTFISFLGLCAAIAMQSCSSGEEPALSGSDNAEAVLSHMIVKFNNKIYETDVETIGDSVKYLNKEYDEIYRKFIANSSDIATLLFTNEEGITCVEYFDTEKDLLKEYDFIQTEGRPCDASEQSTRSRVIDMWGPNTTGCIVAHAELWGDKNFKSTKLITYATTSWSTAIPNLKDLSFNDAISSIRVINRMLPNLDYEISSADAPYHRTFKGSSLRPVLKCTKHSKFEGPVLYCISTPTGSSTNHEDHNLKGIGWNDRITSVGWLLVYGFSVFNGENPVIPGHSGC